MISDLHAELCNVKNGYWLFGALMLATKYSCEVLEQECIGEWGGKHEALVERGIV